MKVLTDLQHIAVQVMNRQPVQFNGATGEDAIRNAINESLGGEFSYQNYRDNMPRFFSVLEEILDVTVGSYITNEFDSIAEVRNTELGDKPSFRVEDTKLFRVARIAGGKNDIRRQRLTNGSFSVETDWFAVATYAEFEQFMAKRIDFAKYIERTAQSFVNDLGTQIYKAVVKAYPLLTTPYKSEGTYDAEVLSALIDHVEAKSGKKAVVYGTRKALRKVNRDNAVMSESLKEAINKVGFYDTFEGTPLFLLPNAHKVGKDEFVVDDNVLFVIPEGEKIVKVVIEGQALVIEKEGLGDRTDMQIEHETLKKMGVGVQQSAIYGAYKITA